jgi:hypothetical protein
MTDNSDNTALARIHELVAEEKALRQQLQHRDISESEEHERLRHLETQTRPRCGPQTRSRAT